MLGRTFRIRIADATGRVPPIFVNSTGDTLTLKCIPAGAGGGVRRVATARAVCPFAEMPPCFDGVKSVAIEMWPGALTESVLGVICAATNQATL